MDPEPTFPKWAASNKECSLLQDFSYKFGPIFPTVALSSDDLE